MRYSVSGLRKYSIGEWGIKYGIWVYLTRCKNFYKYGYNYLKLKFIKVSQYFAILKNKNASVQLCAKPRGDGADTLSPFLFPQPQFPRFVRLWIVQLQMARSNSFQC